MAWPVLAGLMGAASSTVPAADGTFFTEGMGLMGGAGGSTGGGGMPEAASTGGGSGGGGGNPFSDAAYSAGGGSSGMSAGAGQGGQPQQYSSMSMGGAPGEGAADVPFTDLSQMGNLNSIAKAPDRSNQMLAAGLASEQGMAPPQSGGLSGLMSAVLSQNPQQKQKDKSRGSGNNPYLMNLMGRA